MDRQDQPTAVPLPNGGGSGGLSQLAMSMIRDNNGAPIISAPVPDVLLSLAKDDRYISEIISLLSRVMVPFASIFLLRPRGSGSSNNRGNHRQDSDAPSTAYNEDDILEDDGQRFIERIRPELNLLASLIVYSATFIYYTRNFGQSTKSGAESSIQRSLGMESLNLAYRYPINSKQSSPMGKYNNNERQTIRDYLMKALPSISRWHRLLILQTMVPYIIQRVGRGGWKKDLGGILSTIMEQCGLGSPMRSSMRSGPRATNGASESNEQIVRNDDRLRGSARRRLFEEQRRRMLTSSSSFGSDVGGGNATNNERIRDGSAQETAATSSGNSTLFDRRLKRLSTFSWSMIQRISLALSSLSHGAHSLPRHTGSANNNLDRYATAIKWFLRLHLAIFYWNGMYPTIAHRLAGAKIRDDVAPYSAGSPMPGAIVANRPSYKPIAAMIAFQALAALAKTTAEGSIELAHIVQVAFFRWRRRRRLQQQQNSGEVESESEHSVLLNRTNSERAEYMDLIEERVPGLASFKTEAAMKSSKQKSRSKKKTQKEGSSDTQPCGICLNERVDPAAPSVCGHVFCWNCILHWVSNVRAECPLCRAKTRPQEIMPLYNYP